MFLLGRSLLRGLAGCTRLVGPHYFYDVVRLARRGRSTILRCLYIIALGIGLIISYETAPVMRSWRPNDFARISEHFAYTLFLVQNLAVVILTPAYLGSAITEEKERRTLELLFTTQLSSTEIVLGKLFSRLTHLAGFVIAGFPILSILQFWGGIDLALIAGNLCNTLFNMLSIGSFALLVSAATKTVTGSLMVTYAFVLPITFCAAGTTGGFPLVLQDARMGGMPRMTVQEIGVLAIIHLTGTAVCLAFAILFLREREPVERVPGLKKAKAVVERSSPKYEYIFVRKLPEVTTNALMWKELFLGGSSLWLGQGIFASFLAITSGYTFMFVVAIGLKIFTNTDLQDVENARKTIHYLYHPILITYLMAVGYRTAISVIREKQQQTLEPLLLLPIDRREILLAKLMAALLRGWPILVFLGLNVFAGLMIGAYHPFSAVLLCIAPLPVILFIATLGLMMSVATRTMLSATLPVACAIIAMMGCGGVELFGTGRPIFMAFTFSFWDESRRDIWELIVGLALLFLCSLAAVIFWKVAVTAFEDRSGR